MTPTATVVPVISGPQMEALLWMEGGYILVQDPFERWQLCAPASVPGRKVPLPVAPETAGCLIRKGLVEQVKHEPQHRTRLDMREWSIRDSQRCKSFGLTTLGHTATIEGRYHRRPRAKR